MTPKAEDQFDPFGDNSLDTPPDGETSKPKQNCVMLTARELTDPRRLALSRPAREFSKEHRSAPLIIESSDNTIHHPHAPGSAGGRLKYTTGSRDQT